MTREREKNIVATIVALALAYLVVSLVDSCLPPNPDDPLSLETDR